MRAWPVWASEWLDRLKTWVINVKNSILHACVVGFFLNFSWQNMEIYESLFVYSIQITSLNLCDKCREQELKASWKLKAKSWQFSWKVKAKSQRTERTENLKAKSKSSTFFVFFCLFVTFEIFDSKKWSLKHFSVFSFLKENTKY